MRTVVTIKWYDDEGELRETRRHEVFERVEVEVHWASRRPKMTRVEVEVPDGDVADLKREIERHLRNRPCNCGPSEACDRCPRS